jgi:hypothetical protein
MAGSYQEGRSRLTLRRSGVSLTLWSLQTTPRTPNETHLSSLLAGLITIGGCSSPPETPDTPDRFTPEAARQRAQRDFAAGRPRIYSAGGRATFEPGITEDQRALVAQLPRDGSLAGCTNPKVRHSIPFATAYNRKIVTLLQIHDAR